MDGLVSTHIRVESKARILTDVFCTIYVSAYSHRRRLPLKDMLRCDEKEQGTAHGYRQDTSEKRLSKDDLIQRK